MTGRVDTLSAPGGRWPAPPYQGDSGADDPVFWVFVLSMITFYLMVVWATSEKSTKSAVRDRLATMVVTFSARVAGDKRGHLLDDWLADLAGTPEEGRPLSPRQRFRYGRRCLWAALRLRSGDVVDATLRSDARCTVVTLVPLTAAGLMLLRDGGFTNLIGHAEDLGYLGGLGFLSVKWARKRRGIIREAEQPRGEQHE
ncbi:hypothetical protein [Actinoplanes philippinensis]|uniref:hypothetical protein n=1 Tax=Actinoplanes philippinensis TaxID=35752 RepID=UPI00340F2A74